jgi:hypothetical protein
MTNIAVMVDALCRLSEWQTGMKKRDPQVHIGWAAADVIEELENRIEQLLSEVEFWKTSKADWEAIANAKSARIKELMVELNGESDEQDSRRPDGS